MVKFSRRRIFRRRRRERIEQKIETRRDEKKFSEKDRIVFPEVLREIRNFSIILAVKSNASLFLERFLWKVARRFRCGQSSGNHREGIKKEEGVEEAFGADKGGSLEKRQWFLLETVARTVKGNRINARKTSFGLEADPGKPLLFPRIDIVRIKPIDLLPIMGVGTESSCPSLSLSSLFRPSAPTHLVFPIHQKIKVASNSFPDNTRNSNYPRTCNELTIKFLTKLLKKRMRIFRFSLFPYKI